MQRHIWNVMRKRHQGEGGFTLIELLIVILILGVLATIVVLAIGGFQNTGKNAACKTSAKSVESAAAAYYADNNSTWPASIAAMVPTYLKEVPDDVSYDGAGNASCA
jgi:general secretion pathway protein G